jgi:putative membrane protein
MNDTSNKQEAVPNLALIRTDLANERTLLAYGRTALMLVATGVSLVKFLNVTAELVYLGWILIAIGAFVGGTGIVRFASLKRRLDSVRHGTRGDS